MFFMGRLTVLYEPSQEFLHQGSAGEFKSSCGALKPLEELNPNETDHFLLAALFQRINACVRSLVIGKGKVNRQGEQWLLLVECLLDHFQEMSVRLLQIEIDNPRRFAL